VVCARNGAQVSYVRAAQMLLPAAVPSGGGWGKVGLVVVGVQGGGQGAVGRWGWWRHGQAAVASSQRGEPVPSSSKKKKKKKKTSSAYSVRVCVVRW